MDDKLNVETLRALDEAATAGPWDIWREKIADLYAAKLELCLQVDRTENPIDALVMFNAGGKCPGLTGCGPSSDANAQLLTYLRNAVPSILALAEDNARWSGAVATILARCEAIEDESATALESATDQAACGFWRGQKSIAKSIRRELHDLTRALAKENASA